MFKPHVIHHLRIHGAGLDPLLARLRANHLLNLVDFTPACLSPAAILCIRTLRDPLPGTLRLDEAQFFPDQAWHRMMRTEIESLTESAVRPALRFVPATAQAVLFADQAELLACLARDWLSGQVGQRWWWRSILSDSLHTGTVAIWQASPEYVPGALAALGAEAVTFVQRLALADVRRLLDTVITRYDLHHLKTVVEAVPTLDRDIAPMSAPRTSSTAQHAPWPTALAHRFPAPWSPTRELLLGVTLLLTRQPATVRTTSFAEAVQIWLERSAATTQATDPAPLTAEDASSFIEDAPADASVHSETQTPTTPTIPLPLSQGNLERITGWQYNDVTHPSSDINHATTDDEPSSAIIEPFSLGDPLSMSTPGNETITTAYGGVFYLLNAALSLRLYGDFTQPRHTNLALPPWDLLALMGAWFVGADFKADAVWPLLAALRGGEETAPGHDFEAPQTWQVPSEWLEPFDEAMLIWDHTHERRRAWHPAGFWAVDTTEGDLPAEAVIGTVPLPQAADGLERWCEWLAVYLRARLIIALDLEDAAALVPTLLMHPARVDLTPARVDITLALASLPLAIRYAGLDRDPGWIPAAGVSVAFHFEV